MQRHPQQIDVMAQPEGDLGEHLRGTMARLFDDGARIVAIVGSDLPSLTDIPVRAAFDRLRRDPDALVLGPALDGACYLIALIAATHVPPLFEGSRGERRRCSPVRVRLPRVRTCTSI